MKVNIIIVSIVSIVSNVSKYWYQKVNICGEKPVSVVKNQCLHLGLLGGFQSFKAKKVSSEDEK